MSDWKLFHGWMKFQELSANAGLACSYTIGYRVTDDRHEDWTARFNRFKVPDGAAVYGGVNMMRVTVPLLMHHLRLDSPTTVFVPALASHETVASKKGALSAMTHVCAKKTKAGFVSDAITKKAHRPLHKIRGFEKRSEILDEAEYKCKIINAENIFVFDDFITSGNTLSHIAQAIHKTNQKINVYGVGLGKTERRNHLKGPYGSETPNSHVPKKWEELWKAGEDRYLSQQ